MQNGKYFLAYFEFLQQQIVTRFQGQSPCGPPSPNETGHAVSALGAFIGHFVPFMLAGVPLFFQKGEQGGFLCRNLYSFLPIPLWPPFAKGGRA